jgi:hypothetical protein
VSGGFGALAQGAGTALRIGSQILGSAIGTVTSTTTAEIVEKGQLPSKQDLLKKVLVAGIGGGAGACAAAGVGYTLGKVAAEISDDLSRSAFQIFKQSIEGATNSASTKVATNVYEGEEPLKDITQSLLVGGLISGSVASAKQIYNSNELSRVINIKKGLDSYSKNPPEPGQDFERVQNVLKRQTAIVNELDQQYIKNLSVYPNQSFQGKIYLDINPDFEELPQAMTPPELPPKSPPPFGLKKVNQLFENEPTIDMLPKQIEIKNMKDIREIEEKIARLQKQLEELQQALAPIKQALDQAGALQLSQEEATKELAVNQQELIRNKQNLNQLETQNSETALKLTIGLNKSIDVCFIENQRFLEINNLLEKLNVALPTKFLKSEEIKFSKGSIENLETEKADIEEKLKANSKDLLNLYSLKNNQILFKDFKTLFDKKKSSEQLLTRTIGLLKSQLKMLSPTSVSSPITKEKKNLAKAGLAHVLKMNPNLRKAYPELEIVYSLYNNQNANIKMRGEEFHKHLSVT